MLTFPFYHSGAVSHSYLTCHLPGCSGHLASNKTYLTALTLCIFLVDIGIYIIFNHRQRQDGEGVGGWCWKPPPVVVGAGGEVGGGKNCNWIWILLGNYANKTVKWNNIKYWGEGRRWISVPCDIIFQCVKSLQLCSTLWQPKDCSPPGSSTVGFSRQENGVGCHSLYR